MTQEKLDEAIKMFGDDVVNEVREVVSLSDADGSYTLFEDVGKYEHAECVEFLYFED